jgi:hypothetical protein
MHAPAVTQLSADSTPGRVHQRARLIAGVARAQLGLLAPRDIVALNISRSAIARRLASGAWRRVFPGVYAVDDSADTPLQLRKAAQLWAGQDAALSHRSALEAHGLAAQFDAIEVSSSHRRTAPPGVRHHHVRKLPASHVAQVYGVAVTTVERTLVDMAALLKSEADELQALLDECLHRGLVSVEGLCCFLSSGQARRLPGCRVLGRALAWRFRQSPRTLSDAHAQVGRVFRRSRGEAPSVDSDRPPPLALGFEGVPVVLELQGLPLLMDPVRVAHARRMLREAGATIVPLPADLLHLRKARTLVDQVRQELFLARRTAEARRDGPASRLPACDLPRLIARLRTLADYQQLPACFGPCGIGVISSLELGAEDELTPEALEALRVIIDELNALPAR